MTDDVLALARESFRHASTHTATMETTDVGGIGTKGERMLHAIIKQYLTANLSCHEQKVGRYEADVKLGESIFEVQTRRFDRLYTKIGAFLEDYDVTVVYPIAATKYLSWYDPQTRTFSNPRKSSKKGTLCEGFYEIFFLRDYLTHPRFHVRLLLLDMYEYRSLTGWGKDKKRHAPRIERLPGTLMDDVTLTAPADYAQLLPAGLSVFTVKELAKALKLRDEPARRAVHVLMKLGMVEEYGKDGRAKRYLLREEYRHV